MALPWAKVLRHCRGGFWEVVWGVMRRLGEGLMGKGGVVARAGEGVFLGGGRLVTVSYWRCGGPGGGEVPRKGKPGWGHMRCGWVPRKGKPDRGAHVVWGGCRER